MIHSCGGWKSEKDLPRLESKCQQDYIPFGNPGEESISLPFELLKVVYILWLMAPSHLQSQ